MPPEGDSQTQRQNVPSDALAPPQKVGDLVDEPRPVDDVRRVVGRLASGAAWSTLGSAIGRGFTLAGTIAIARLLGPEEYGAWGVTQSTIGAASGLAALGASLTAAKHVAQYRNRDPSIAGGRAMVALLTAGVGATLTAGGLASAASPIATAVFHHASFDVLLRLGAPALAFGTLSGAQLGVLVGLESFRATAVVNVIRGLSVCVLMVLGAKILGVQGAVAGLSIGEVVGAFTGWVALRRASRQQQVALSVPLAWRERATLWRFSLPVFLAALAVQPAMWIGQVVLVRGRDGLVQAGYFAYAYRWYLFIMFFAAAIAPVGLSILTNVHSTAGRDLHRRVVRLNLVLTLIVAGIPAAAVIASAHWLTHLGGAAFTPAANSLFVLALACVVTALNTVISQAALSMDMILAWIASDVVLALVLAGTAVALVPSFGSIGLAWAYLAAMVATCAVLLPPVMIGLKRPTRVTGA